MSVRKLLLSDTQNPEFLTAHAYKYKIITASKNEVGTEKNDILVDQ